MFSFFSNVRDLVEAVQTVAGLWDEHGEDVLKELRQLWKEIQDVKRELRQARADLEEVRSFIRMEGENLRDE